MLEIGKTYKFRVIGSFLNKKEERMFELELASSLDENTYVAFPIKSQRGNMLPAFIYCRVKAVDEKGRVKLEQDEYALYNYLYDRNKLYDFFVESQIDDSKAGKKRYLVSNKLGYTHIYTVHRAEDELVVGTNVQFSVQVKKGMNDSATLYLYVPKSDLGIFKPQTVFEGCHHSEDYEKYFCSLKSTMGIGVKFSDMIKEMQEKIKMNNRLWIFDYITALFCYLASFDNSNLDELERINRLIRDIEIWLLEESGILAKFNPENREITRQKSEQIIDRVEAVNEAIALIKENKQSSFLQDNLNKLRKSLYLRNRKRVFSILYNLITLDNSIVEHNMVEFSELIDYSSYEINDTYVLERMVNVLSTIINANRKKVNAELHYLRNEKTDKKALATLVVGIGTLLNFHAIKNLDKKNDFGIQTNQLFPTLCKYLSFLTSSANSLALTNKALQWVLGNDLHIKFPGKILRNVQEDSESLIQYILNLQITPADKPYRMVKDSIFMKYENGKLSVTKLPEKVTVSEDEVRMQKVYSVPGTCLDVVSFTDKAAWKNSDSLAYYKDKWKEMLMSLKLQCRTEKEFVRIKTKAINHDYKGLVFCARADAFVKDDGVISFKGYAPNFKIENLDEIFDAGMHFNAKFSRNEKGQVNYDIIDDIVNFSVRQLNDTPDVQRAVCIGYSNYFHKATFITEYGITCECDINDSQKVVINQPYEVKLSFSKNAECPICVVQKVLSDALDKIVFLKKQLKGISDYNKKEELYDENVKYQSQFPYIHLILDNYLRLFDDKIVKYNLLQIVRLVALAEKSTLSNYYTSCIQYMELKDSFVENGDIDYSVQDFEWDDKLLTQFPSLRNRANVFNLLKNFGADNDLEYLYQLVTSTSVSEQTSKFARLSLAASLIESVSDDERPICYLKRIVAEEFCDVQGKKDSLENIDFGEDETSENKEINFGIEGQHIEFKTSIAYYAGNQNHQIDFESQIFVILKVVAGFLNAKGGVLYIGVKDDSTPMGIEADLSALKCNIDKYERLIRENIVKEFNKDVNSVIDFEFFTVSGVTICKIIVPEYYTALALRGDFYQRQGNETRIIKGNDLVMFIRRKLEGKHTIILDDSKKQKRMEDNNAISDAPVHQVSVGIESQINDNAHALEVYFYEDGTYVLGSKIPGQEMLAHLSVSKEQKSMFLLQCYDNGCINKVPVKNFFNMQIGYRYKNGINRDANLVQVIVASNSDFVAITCRQSTDDYIKVFPIVEISAHTTLGLKGNQLLSQNYDVVLGFYVVEASSISNLQRLVSSTRSNLGRKMSSSSFEQEIACFKEMQNSQLVQNVSIGKTDNINMLLDVIRNNNIGDFKAYIDSQISKDRNIPKVRKEIQMLLQKSQGSEEFWQIVEWAISTNIALFRQPIAEIIDADIIEKNVPDTQVLDRIVRQLFTFDHKYGQSLDLVYPVRKYLSQEAKDYISEMSKDLRSPEEYEFLFTISQKRLEDELDFLCKENNVSSNYATFEILDSYKKHRGEDEVKQYAYMCLSKLSDTTAMNLYLKDLLYMYILNRKPKSFSEKVLKEIREEGFEAFRTACVVKNEKDKSVDTVEYMQKLVGTIVNGKVVREYSRHYLLNYKDGVMILLQKTWCEKKHDLGDTVSVKVLNVNKKQKVMFATEVDDTFGLPEKQYLLNEKEQIEVSFSEYNGFYIPSVRKNYSRLKVRVVSYPLIFDVKKHYRAVVVKRNSNFEYDIRLLEAL